MMFTASLKPGDDVRLISFGQVMPAYRSKLLAMGITPGVNVRVLRIAPLGCPMQLEVRGTTFAIRKQDAWPLQWEKL